MWYYSNGGQQAGPVDDSALDDLARQGIVRADTLVWREGMGSWQPYGTVRVPAQPPVAYAPQPVYTPPAPAGPYMDFALWPTRAMGAIVDWLFVLAMMVVLYFVVFVAFGSIVGLSALSSNQFSDFGSTACCCMLLLTPVSTILVGLYNKVYLLSKRGYSVGQGMMKIKTVDAHGNKLEMGKAFLRLVVQAAMSLVWFLSILDYLWPLWDLRRQTLHDKAVDSYVVSNPTGL